MSGILINADTMDRDNSTEVTQLVGNVQIVYQGQHIKADRAIVRMRNRQMELSGHVEIVTPKTTIGGEEIKLDFESSTGLIYNGFVQSGSVIFEGRLLEKIAEDEYFVSEANYTACTNCPATWSFSGSSIRAELGGYAYIKNSFLRVGGVPVLWFPYLILPLKSDRQSGLLTPGFENSNSGGAAFSQPYFWAISRSQDATFTLKNYSLRGLKVLGEYRYVPNENSYGELSVASIQDRVFSSQPRVNTFRSQESQGSSFNRWFMRYNHYHELPEGYTQRAQLNVASDLEYPKDFPFETLNFGDSAMENRLSLTKNTQHQHWSMEGDYYINMLHSNPLSDNDDAVHRLPELRFAQIPQNIADTDWLYSVDLNYVNFARAGTAYDELSPIQTVSGTQVRGVKNDCADDPNYDRNPACNRTYSGAYNPATDLIRTGQRLDFQPSIYRSFKVINGIDITPKISYRETHYTFSVGDDMSNTRRYIRTELNNRMTFSSIHGDLRDPKSDRYKHEIIPEVTYTSIPWLNHPAHPFFGTGKESPSSPRDNISDGDLGNPFGLQFDYNDRIYDRNLVTFAVTNKLVQKSWANNRPEYRQIASLKIAQSYDAYQERQGGPYSQPWSDITTTLDVRLNQFQAYSIFKYFPRQNVTDISSRVRLLNNKGQFIQVALTEQYNVVPGTPDINRDKRTEDYTISSGLTSRYINLMGQVVYNANWANSDSRKQIKSWAYIAQFKPPGDCWIINLIQNQVTGGDTNLAFSFDFTFDGVPKPALAPEALDAFRF